MSVRQEYLFRGIDFDGQMKTISEVLSNNNVDERLITKITNEIARKIKDIPSSKLIKNTEEGLDRCPHCGSTASFYPDGDMEGHSVICSGDNDQRNNCPNRAFGYDSQEEARLAWNTRFMPGLTVRFTSMPESNGNKNWTVLLTRQNSKDMIGSISSGLCFYRSEYYDRARYHADRLKYLIGESDREPDILDYDSEMKEPPPGKMFDNF